jgi:hypothetical protein
VKPPLRFPDVQDVFLKGQRQKAEAFNSKSPCQSSNLDGQAMRRPLMAPCQDVNFLNYFLPLNWFLVKQTLRRHVFSLAKQGHGYCISIAVVTS